METKATPSEFTDPEPKLETYAARTDLADPYAEWVSDRADWRAQKREFDRQQAASVATAKQSVEARNAKHFAAVRVFQQTHPDYLDKVKQAGQAGYTLPQVVEAAILEDDNGPRLLYSLLGQPDEMDRLVLTMGSTPVTPQSVVAMRRFLASLATRGTAGKTGAATTRTVRDSPPPPPTPVRTGLAESGGLEPDDDAGLAAHEAAYHRLRRR